MAPPAFGNDGESFAATKKIALIEYDQASTRRIDAMSFFKSFLTLLFMAVLSVGWTQAQWIQTGKALTEKVFALAASPDGAGGSDLFAGTHHGIYLSTDNGTSWTAVDNGLRDTVVNALVSSAVGNAAYIFAGTSGGLYVSTDNGAKWLAADAGLTDLFGDTLAINTILASRNSDGGVDLYAGTNGGYGLFLSTNMGASWSVVDSSAFIGLYGQTGGVVALAISPNGEGGKQSLRRYRWRLGTLSFYGQRPELDSPWFCRTYLCPVPWSITK